MTNLLTEQELPKKGIKVIVNSAIDRIIFTLYKQNSKGYNKYGAYLSTFNGRNSVRDIWEEIADTVNYAEALCQEYDEMRAMLYTLYHQVPEAQEYMENNFPTEVLNFITIEYTEYVKTK